MGRTGITALEKALKHAGGAVRLRSARLKDLKLAKKAGFPKELIEFYRKHEPDQEYVQLDDKLYCIAGALRKNRAGTPGGTLSSEGFIAFAGTRSEDFYCIDTNVTTELGLHPIVLLDRTAAERARDLVDIWAARVEVASSLDDFLFRFAGRMLGSREIATEISGLPADEPELKPGRSGIQMLKAALSRAGGAGRLGPAKGTDLKRAEKAGFPRELLAFYRKYEPAPEDDYIELCQRIFCIRGSLRENRECMPGVGLFPHGYVVFAGTSCGDAYCFDTNVKGKRALHPIVLFGHEVIDKSTDLEYIQASRVEVASSLDDFLRKFSLGKLAEEPRYPAT
jgi:hypothetical protein